MHVYYSSEWRQLRREELIRDGYRCVVCGADVSAPGAATVDHRKPRKTHPHLGMEPSNLRMLCRSRRQGGNGCDNQAHREKGSGGGERIERFVIQGCDADGWPSKPGPPRLR